MHGKAAQNEAPRAGEITERIAVDASADMAHKRTAQQFKAHLEDRLNPETGAPSFPAYRLSTSLAVVEAPVGISPDGTVSRYNVILTATLSLTRASDGALVYAGTARRTGSYNNVTSAFYSTYTASQDTIRRTATGLAEDVELRLAAFFAQNPHPQPLNPAAPAS
jgi:hypothetical protein